MSLPVPSNANPTKRDGYRSVTMAGTGSQKLVKIKDEATGIDLLDARFQNAEWNEITVIAKTAESHVAQQSIRRLADYTSRQPDWSYHEPDSVKRRRSEGADPSKRSATEQSEGQTRQYWSLSGPKRTRKFYWSRDEAKFVEYGGSNLAVLSWLRKTPEDGGWQGWSFDHDIEARMREGKACKTVSLKPKLRFLTDTSPPA